MHGSILFFGTRGAIPGVDSGHTSFLLRLPAAGDGRRDNGARRFLVDASGNPVRDLLRVGLGMEDLDGVVLTHAHADHMYGFPSLVHTLRGMGRKSPLRVLADADTRRVARGLLELFRVDPDRPGFELIYAEGVQEPGLEIRLIPAEHSIPSRMVRFAGGPLTLLYTSDTRDGPWIRAAARGCGVLVHEASGPHSELQRLLHFVHSSALQAGQNAQAAAVERLFLCHFGAGPAFAPRRMGLEARRAFRGRIVIPRPFQEYRLPGRAGGSGDQAPPGTEAR